LESISDLARHWEADLTVPVRTALDQRDTLRQEIADYRTHFGLQEPQSQVVG
jgi:hypothetical protein